MIVRASIFLYRPPRFICLAGTTAPPIIPGVGVVAGCTIASTWARVALVGVLDRLNVCPSPNVQCNIAVYIDDFVISAEGAARPLVRSLSRITMSLQAGLENEVGAKISAQKAIVVASSSGLAYDVRRALGPLGGKAAASAIVLGVDTCGGRGRAAVRTSAFAARAAKCGTRCRRLRRVTAATSAGRTAKLFSTGIRPAAAYGADVVGASPAFLRRLRLQAAATMRPRARGRSLTAVSLVHGDPAGVVGVAAAGHWAGEAWRAAGRDEHATSLGSLQALCHAARSHAVAASWRTARGPIAVAFLELGRIGWQWNQPFSFVRPDGASICLLSTSPQAVRHQLHQATLFGLARRLAGIEGSLDGDRRRVIYEPVCAFLRASAPTPRSKGVVRALFSATVCGRATASPLLVTRSATLAASSAGPSAVCMTASTTACGSAPAPLSRRHEAAFALQVSLVRRAALAPHPLPSHRRVLSAIRHIGRFPPRVTSLTSPCMKARRRAKLP